MVYGVHWAPSPPEKWPSFRSSCGARLIRSQNLSLGWRHLSSAQSRFDHVAFAAVTNL